MVIPNKLKPGDEVRIVAPAESLSIISKEGVELAQERLEKLGLKVSYGKNIHEQDEFDSSSVQSRVEDIHDAFKDENVKGILTVVGGYNTNQILSYLDYELIKNNPKILCGFSDITALQGAIFRKIGLVTYSGPHFSSFGMVEGFSYTLEYFKKALMQDEEFTIKPSEQWSDDLWFIDQEDRKFIDNKGYFVINEGEAEGTIVGDNLCTLNLLQGTGFMPSLKGAILFIEDDSECTSGIFDRDLQSLMHLDDFKNVKAIVIGRFQKDSKISIEKLKTMIKAKKELQNIPIVANIDFGHTSPKITFPIGGIAKVIAKDNKVELMIKEH
jgi:muramoyltetrapeptide carboxypeptidase LdcA involved in peptidoglycan recycling